jgi:hypothetical protein
VADDRRTIRFPRKIIFCFNCPRHLDADVKSRGVGSLKDFEIRSVIEKEPRSARCTSYQADRNGYLHEVKIESPEQMLDRVNNRSGRSAGTKKSEPDQRLAEELIYVIRQISNDQHLPRDRSGPRGYSHTI